MSPHSLARYSFTAVLLLSFSAYAFPNKLKITSTPPGAIVELDDNVIGVTPCEQDFPSTFFKPPKTAFDKRLRHPVRLRLTLKGFLPKEIVLTQGPSNWVDLRGHSHGEYWLFKAESFSINLAPIPPQITPTLEPRKPPASVDVRLSTEKLISLAEPLVVRIQSDALSGSGFFLDDSGLLATSAHVVDSQLDVTVTLATSQQVTGRVIYRDQDMDLAFVRVPVPATGFPFRYMLLANLASVAKGDAVIAIGHPADGMPLTVTQGIISAIGKFSSADAPTWIQTDAALNPGNSGGPLLNTRGEIVGMTSEKPSARSTTGIAFALSAADLSTALRNFTSMQTPLTEKLGAPAIPLQVGQVRFLEPEGAAVYIDYVLRGQIPFQVRLPAGLHRFFFLRRGASSCFKFLRVLPDADATLNGDCFPGQ